MTIKSIHFYGFLFAAIWLVSINAEVVGKIHRGSCIVHDPVTVQNVSCWAKPFNRTSCVFNLRAKVVRPVQHVAINIQLFRRRNLKYKQFLVNVTEDYCQFFAKDKGGIYIRILTDIYLKHTNLNHECPYIGDLYIEDLPLGPNNLPPIWPNGEYRMDILVTTNNKRLITIQFFGELKDILRRP